MGGHGWGIFNAIKKRTSRQRDAMVRLYLFLMNGVDLATLLSYGWIGTRKI